MMKMYLPFPVYKAECWMATKKNRTALEKCTHLYNDTQGPIKPKCFQQRVFVRCKKREKENNKKEVKKIDKELK